MAVRGHLEAPEVVGPGAVDVPEIDIPCVYSPRGRFEELVEPPHRLGEGAGTLVENVLPGKIDRESVLEGVPEVIQDMEAGARSVDSMA